MTAPSVTVCIPWIETGCEWRKKARNWTMLYWADLNVNFSTTNGDVPPGPLNRSAARNIAAQNVQSDVLFFCDADMWVPPEQFAFAVALAAELDVMVLAYTKHTRLTKWATERTYAGTPTLQGQTIQTTIGGAFAVSRKVHDLVGGHDERFWNWGGEDRAFEYACRTLAGPTQRIPGVSYHLWHPRGKDQARVDKHRRAGLDLAHRYKALAGDDPARNILRRTRGECDPEGMRALLSEPGGPLDTVSASDAPVG